jgi:thymidine kinase
MAKLYFYYSSMNAGKSTTLLQSSFNYQERGMATMLWTAAIDDRYGHGRVASRIGLEADAHLFDPQVDMFAAVAQRALDRRDRLRRAEAMGFVQDDPAMHGGGPYRCATGLSPQTIMIAHSARASAP